MEVSLHYLIQNMKKNRRLQKIKEAQQKREEEQKKKEIEAQKKEAPKSEPKKEEVEKPIMDFHHNFENHFPLFEKMKEIKNEEPKVEEIKEKVKMEENAMKDVKFGDNELIEKKEPKMPTDGFMESPEVLSEVKQKKKRGKAKKEKAEE